MNKNTYKRLMGRFANYCFTTRNHHIAESLRPNQIASKEWLVYEITKFKTEFNRVAVLGSWNSVLLYELMLDYAKVEHWDFYDIEVRYHEDRDKYFNANGMPINYHSFTTDAVEMFSRDTIVNQYDLIINPSCEHMIDIPAQKGPMYALTSNDYNGVNGHINLVEHETDLAVKNNINNILYKGSLKLPNYTRYCVVGYAE